MSSEEITSSESEAGDSLGGRFDSAAPSRSSERQRENITSQPPHDGNRDEKMESSTSMAWADEDTMMNPSSPQNTRKEHQGDNVKAT